MPSPKKFQYENVRQLETCGVSGSSRRDVGRELPRGLNSGPVERLIFTFELVNSHPLWQEEAGDLGRGLASQFHG